MLPEKAEEMLRDYKRCKGRCSFLETEIAELKEAEKQLFQQCRNDLLTGGGAQQLDGMPHGNSVGNPTERIAMMLIGGYVSDDITSIRNELRKDECEYAEKRVTVVIVEAWLTGLTAKEVWLIERIYFDGLTYREINGMYREHFRDICSKETLRRIKKCALAKIYDMAQ